MIFQKKLLKDLLRASFGVFFVLTGIVLAQRVAYYIGTVSKGLISISIIPSLLAFNLLKFLPFILSLTLFIAVLLTVSRQYRDNEIIAWFNAGISLLHWIRPIFLFTIPIILVIGLLNFLVVPWAIQQADDFIAKVNNRDDLSTIVPGVFKESKSGERVFFIEGLDHLGKQFNNLFMRTTNVEANKLSIVFAKKAERVTLSNGARFFIMQQGRYYEKIGDIPIFSSTTFEHYGVFIPEKLPSLGSTRTSSLPSNHLFFTRDRTAHAELQRRISPAISTIILILFAISFSFTDNRISKQSNLIIAGLVFMIYSNLLSIMETYVALGKIPIWSGAWSVHLFFLLLAIYFLYRRIYR